MGHSRTVPPARSARTNRRPSTRFMSLPCRVEGIEASVERCRRWYETGRNGGLVPFRRTRVVYLLMLLLISVTAFFSRSLYGWFAFCTPCAVAAAHGPHTDPISGMFGMGVPMATALPKPATTGSVRSFERADRLVGIEPFAALNDSCDAE